MDLKLGQFLYENEEAVLFLDFFCNEKKRTQVPLYMKKDTFVG
ncbi:hypothetical protein [Halalkalibacterium ligniniphilum]|nr:hypothetical protein [Halalkalibacterium ligniniphilum]